MVARGERGIKAICLKLPDECEVKGELFSFEF